MDRMTVLQEAIDRTKTAAASYPGQRGPVMEIQGRDILTGPGVEDGWTLGVLHRTVLQIAETHDGCTERDCRICASVGEGLAASLRALRRLQAGELEAGLHPMPRWRRWLWTRTGLSRLVG